MPKKESKDYAINTYTVFAGLQDCYRDFDRQFLLHQVQNKFRNVLSRGGIRSVDFDGTNEDYLAQEEKNYELEKADIKDNLNYFPFPDYCMGWHKDLKHRAVIYFRESYQVPKDDTDFNFFFALQFYVNDLMEYHDFLNYHLEHTFLGELEEFKKFLDLICLKYKTFLGDSHKEVIELFFKEKISEKFPKNDQKTHEKLIENSEKHIESDSYTENEENSIKKEFTTARQVLAIKYLLDELGVNHVDKTEIARFIQFITGREVTVSKIHNTNIYKRLKNPLSLSEKHAEDDLKFIRDYFEKLDLKAIVNKINKEIGSKE